MAARELAPAEMVARVPAVPRTVVQEILVVGVALGCVLLSHPTGFPWSEPAAIVACCALPLRLKWPWLTMLFCLWGLAGELGLAPALVGLYRIGRTAKSPWVTVGWAFASVAVVETVVLAGRPIAVRDATLSVLFAILWMVSPSALGMLITTRQRLATSLADLKLAREAELDARAERARAAERSRIGREIHDAVGHHATLIAVEAAALEATSAEDDTKAAANRIRGLAKESLGEMRSALGLASGRPETGNGLPEVADLITTARRSGMSVTFKTPADIEVLPAVGRAAYRIVQESLTNAAKHAPGTQVHVTLNTDEGLLVITTTSGPSNSERTHRTGGLGLQNMLERATTAGGTLDITRGSDGKFTVRARLPLESYRQPKVDDTQPTIDGSQAALDTR